MPLQLMKLAISGSGDIDVKPTVQRFFYVTTLLVSAGGTLTIDAADFMDDTGTALGLTGELPALTADNSYYNVFLNGVLQMEGISTYTPGATTVGSVEIEAIGSDIIVGTSVVVEVVNYAPDSTITFNT